jgi:predicted TIM-barrel fold metal-dependent hydrolase
LEEVLVRHPKLKIWAMHAGYPMIEHMIALMGANAYVYVDISGMIWSYPLMMSMLIYKGWCRQVLEKG